MGIVSERERQARDRMDEAVRLLSGIRMFEATLRYLHGDAAVDGTIAVLEAQAQDARRDWEQAYRAVERAWMADYDAAICDGRRPPK